MERVEAGVVVSSLRETIESWALVRVVRMHATNNPRTRIFKVFIF